jgi:hypothetical protein
VGPRSIPEQLCRAYLLRVVTIVRLARVLLIAALACMAISFVIALSTSETGPVEKLVVLGLLGGCVYAAARVTTLTEWAVQRLTRH